MTTLTAQFKDKQTVLQKSTTLWPSFTVDSPPVQLVLRCQYVLWRLGRAGGILGTFHECQTLHQIKQDRPRLRLCVAAREEMNTVIYHCPHILL